MSADILVIGGGYAGRMAANRLAATHRVRLLDPSPHRVQRIALHRLAARGSSVCTPMGRSLNRAVQHVAGRAIGIEEGCVHTAAHGRLRADRILLALGSTTSPPPAPGLHQIGDLEGAQALYTALQGLNAPRVLVLGSGLTGLELGAELAHARPDAHIHILGRSTLDGGLSMEAARMVRDRLQRLGVRLSEQVKVRSATPEGVDTDAGWLPADLVVWCGGMVANGLARASGLPVDEAGRVLVDDGQRVVGHPSLFAAGDAARIRGRDRQEMGCVLALPMGAHAARTVAEDLAGRPLTPFGFNYVLRCIELGGGSAVVQHTDALGRPTSAMRGLMAAATKAFIYRLVLDAPQLEARTGLPLYTWSGQGKAA